MTDSQRITLLNLHAAFNATAAAHSDASMVGDAAAIAYLIRAMEEIEAAMAAIEAASAE
jgi:hypothetical protein